MISFLTGGIADDQAMHFYDKITELRSLSLQTNDYQGVDSKSLTLDTPIPYSLARLWLELIDEELKTLEGSGRDQPALMADGEAASLTPPKYKLHAMGSAGPFLNPAARGIKRQLVNLRSRLLDKRYDFLLHSGEWEPDTNGATIKTLSDLLRLWLGHEQPITILDLSGIPSQVLIRLIGSILRIVYEALFWSREKSEGAVARPLLTVMEEAHRYLGGEVQILHEKWHNV